MIGEIPSGFYKNIPMNLAVEVSEANRLHTSVYHEDQLQMLFFLPVPNGAVCFWICQGVLQPGL